MNDRLVATATNLGKDLANLRFDRFEIRPSAIEQACTCLVEFWGTVDDNADHAGVVLAHLDLGTTAPRSRRFRRRFARIRGVCTAPLGATTLSLAAGSVVGLGACEVRFRQLGLGLGLLLEATGCPANTCFLTVNGRCKWSSCPDGAEFDTSKRSCICEVNRIPLNGACLTAEAANQYCGKGAHFQNGGCTPNRCPPGSTSTKIPGPRITPEQATQVASNMGVSVGKNQKLGCPAGEQLVVEGARRRAFPLQQTCGRDEVWNGAACQKSALCPRVLRTTHRSKRA